MRYEFGLIALLIPSLPTNTNHEAQELKTIRSVMEATKQLRTENHNLKQYYDAIIACTNEQGYIFWINEQPLKIQCKQLSAKKKN